FLWFAHDIQVPLSPKPQPWVTPFYAPLLRAAIWPLVYRIRRQVLNRVNRGLSGRSETIESQLFSTETEPTSGQSAADCNKVARRANLRPNTPPGLLRL